jgi:hypothetical protein
VNVTRYSCYKYAGTRMKYSTCDKHWINCAELIIIIVIIIITPWSESASELYRPSDRRCWIDKETICYFSATVYYDSVSFHCTFMQKQYATFQQRSIRIQSHFIAPLCRNNMLLFSNDLLRFSLISLHLYAETICYFSATIYYDSVSFHCTFMQK